MVKSYRSVYKSMRKQPYYSIFFKMTYLNIYILIFMVVIISFKACQRILRPMLALMLIFGYFDISIDILYINGLL